jgi:hypothetical protein
MMNDEEVLTCSTLWSDKVLNSTRNACAGDINLEEVLLTLRKEAIKREVNME